MDTSSFSPDTSMDTSQDFPPSPGGVVRWVASQSPNPALQALIKEAERDRRTRPSTPVHEPTSWTYPLTYTTSSAPLSTSVSSARRSGGHNSPDLSCHLPPCASSSSTSSLSPVAHTSEPSVSRRAKPLAAAQRWPLASSAPPANQPSHHSTRLRSSSHSTLNLKGKYTPRDDEPEALFFIDLLKDASRQVDKNSEKKERAAREKERGKGKECDQPLGWSGVDNRTDLDSSDLSAQPPTETSSTFAILTSRALEKVSGMSTSARKPKPRGRSLAKTASLGAPISGKSTPTSLPSPNLNCDFKLAPPRLFSASNTSGADHTSVRNANVPEIPTNNDESAMQDAIGLTDSDMEWERPIFSSTTHVQVDDDEESDTAMDVSFFKPESVSRSCTPAPKPNPRHSQSTRPSAPTQRARTGPPPLGMRRAPQLQSSQYSSTQGSKGATIPRFKPPLPANSGGTSNKCGSGSTPATATSSRLPPRGSATTAPAAEAAAPTNQDPDSSFDISFDVDADALEEAMKAYD